jgi:hypothetical protein
MSMKMKKLPRGKLLAFTVQGSTSPYQYNASTNQYDTNHPDKGHLFSSHKSDEYGENETQAHQGVSLAHIPLGQHSQPNDSSQAIQCKASYHVLVRQYCQGREQRQWLSKGLSNLDTRHPGLERKLRGDG